MKFYHVFPFSFSLTLGTNNTGQVYYFEGRNHNSTHVVVVSVFSIYKKVEDFHIMCSLVGS